MKNYLHACIVTLLPSLFLAACDSTEDASRIVMGTGNKIVKLNELQYQKAFSIQVTDINGNPAGGTEVDIAVRSMEYHKGGYIVVDDNWSPVYAASCDAEDLNNNGFLDAGEDINNNGHLDPTNPATISAHPSETPTYEPTTHSIVTDDNGFGYFAITYPQSEALWVTVRLTASARVSGSEATEVYEHRLTVLIDDLSDISISPPGGVESKYGVASDCTNPN